MKIDYEKYDADILRLAQLVKNVYSDGVKGVYGIPRGGYYPAIRLAEYLQCPVSLSCSLRMNLPQLLM